jgi:hypothetical protein
VELVGEVRVELIGGFFLPLVGAIVASTFVH